MILRYMGYLFPKSQLLYQHQKILKNTSNSQAQLEFIYLQKILSYYKLKTIKRITFSYTLEIKHIYEN